MLFLSPHRQPEPLLGLDLQADAVRLVALGRTRQGRQTLEHCACEPLAPGWVAEGRIDHFEAVAEAVSRLLRRTRVHTVKVAMALPEAAVITRRITLPRAMTPESLQARVRSEAEQLIPFPLQEVYLDYGVLAPDAASPGAPPARWVAQEAQGADRMDLLLVAARRERVRDLQALAEAVGLKPVLVDVADFAARRAVRHLLAACVQTRMGASVEPTLAVLDLRTDRIVWRLLQGDEVLHDKEFAWDPTAPAVPGETDPVLAVAGGLAHAMSSALASGTGARIEAAWLTGEVGNCTGLAEALAGFLGCPCRVANPFEGMLHRRSPPWRIVRGTRGPGWAAPETGAASAYLPACGLALRRFQP